MDTGVWLTKSRADIRIQCLCIDTNDPAKTAQFWQAALGWRRTFDEEDQIVLEPPEGSPEDGIVPDCCYCVFRSARRSRIGSTSISP